MWTWQKWVATGEEGGELASGATEAAHESDIVQICVLETSSVRDIVVGKGGTSEIGQAGIVAAHRLPKVMMRIDDGEWRRHGL
jgi:3-hydroxyisobutyrate dehydrogenase-like beta-hydroxyacid dehydrogenase